jgi:hypothetical protein
MGYSNCSKCGKPSNKLICNTCITEAKSAEEQIIRNRLNDLALISHQDYELANKETISLMESPKFSGNCEAFWDQVRNNPFLENCYYRLKLGNSFSKDTILNLPDYAFKNIPFWASVGQKNEIALKADRFYKTICKEEEEKCLKQLIKQREERDNSKKEIDGLIAKVEKNIKRRVKKQHLRENLYSAFSLCLKIILIIFVFILIFIFLVGS